MVSKDPPTSEPLCNSSGIPQWVESERLVIRLWEPGDAAAANDAVTASIEHLRPWMPWIAAETLAVDDRRALIARWRTEWEQGGDAVYAMLAKGSRWDESDRAESDRAESDSLTVVGGTGLHRRIGSNGLEIGYWVHVDHIGQGYASEASAALTATALAIDGIDLVEIRHDRANVASAGVPAKLGYTLVGEEPREVSAPSEVGIVCIWRITG